MSERIITKCQIDMMKRTLQFAGCKGNLIYSITKTGRICLEQGDKCVLSDSTNNTVEKLLLAGVRPQDINP